MKKIVPFILILTPILFSFYYFFTFQSNVPFADDWSAINGLVIRFFYGNDSFFDKLGLIVAQCNEHREGFLAVVSLFQYAILGKINYTFFNLVGIFGSLGMIGIFGHLFFKKKFSVYFFIPLVYIFLNASYYHNFYWPTSALQHNSVVFFVLMALYFLYQKMPIGYAIGVGALAIFTSANGFLLFFAAVPLLKEYSKRDRIAWTFSGLILLILYLYGYQQPVQRNGLLQNIVLIKEIFLTSCAYLGAFVAVFFPQSFPLKIPLSIGIGIAMIPFLIYRFYQAFWGAYQSNRVFHFSISLQLFVILTVGLYSISRANLPLESVFESRYGINHAVLLASLVLQIACSTQNQKYAYLISLFSILFFFSSYFFRSLEIYQFNRANVAAAISQRGNNRDYFFHFIQGKKVDLTAPNITELNDLPKPLVDFTSSLPSAGKYYNDVIQVTFSNQVYQLPTLLEKIYLQLSKNQMLSVQNIPLTYKWEVADDKISFIADKLKIKANNGQDGFYLVLQNLQLKPIVYALNFHQIDIRQQVLHPFSVCLRNAAISIPYSVLPNGKYTGQIVQLENEKLVKIASQNFEVKFDKLKEYK
ncbi:MAG: hypothetical protein RJA76_126 [Bacteroidota bacterium]|jgi:hypothetical protein